MAGIASSGLPAKVQPIPLRPAEDALKRRMTILHRFYGKIVPIVELFLESEKIFSFGLVRAQEDARDDGKGRMTKR